MIKRMLKILCFYLLLSSFFIRIDAAAFETLEDNRGAIVAIAAEECFNDNKEWSTASCKAVHCIHCLFVLSSPSLLPVSQTSIFSSYYQYKASPYVISLNTPPPILSFFHS